MHYNSGMGEYTNDYMEPILGTCYLTDVPYKIDKEKYNKIVSNLEKEKKYTIAGCRFNDADVVSFHLEAYYSDDDDEYDKPILKSKSLTIFPQNSPKDSGDFYDCFQVWYDNCVNVEEEYEFIVNAILGTVIEPDDGCVVKLIDELTAKKADLDNNINTLNKIIDNNLIHEIKGLKNEPNEDEIKQKFKKGDFLKDEFGNIFICNEAYKTCWENEYLGIAFCVLFNNMMFAYKDWIWRSCLVSYATEEEKERLLKVINEKGYM